MCYGAMMIVERMHTEIARGVTESYKGQSILGLSDWGVTESSDTVPRLHFSPPLGEK